MGQLERRSKSNKKFMVLSAIGIFMVADSHTFTTFHFFGDFIPYNSFFMPMFVFISGYFNKVDSSTNLLKYIWKKIKTLLLPYIGISLFVFGIEQLLNWYKSGEKPAFPGWYLKYMWDRILTVGTFGTIVEPMWFVIALFVTLIVYALLKKFLCKFWNSYVMFVLFCIGHLFVISFAKKNIYECSPYLLIPLKCLFFMPFLELGIIYRDHLEKKHESLPGGCKIGILALMLFINMIRTTYLPLPYDLAFDALNEMTGFTSPYIVTPLVSSLIGILFWLTFVDLIGKPVYESKFVNFMSCNTFWIMGMHVLFFNLLNFVFLVLYEHGVPLLYFDAELFRATEWYFWEITPTIKYAYLMAGVLGPLGLKWLWDLATSKLRGKHKAD
ncbi:MAG: acyltransferase [Lachnospiraceae bacterium]|nr:acyltransferase [Lachnospiraceae bacterium]